MEFKPASSISPEHFCIIFNDTFSNYIHGPIVFSPATLAQWIARENIDLELSKLFVQNGTPIGFGLISRHGDAIRLASFGVVPAAVEKGVGTLGLAHLVKEARERGDSTFELEAIEQNARAIRLYSRAGFAVMRRLFGWEAVSPPAKAGADARLQAIPIPEAAAIVSQYASPDLPWQAAGFNIIRREAPDIAYRLDDAYVVISNPYADDIRVFTLIVVPEKRRQGQAARLAEALFARHPGKNWKLNTIFPEDYGGDLGEKLGFKKLALNQVQMRLLLSRNYN